VTISRRTLIIVAMLAVAIAIFFGWRSRSWSYANLPPTAYGPWVAFGDSLTEGFGAPPGGDYPSQLGARLGVPIRNMGVSGDTSANGLARLPAVEALSPRVVLLCFGGNDVLQNRSRTEMISNVGTMVERLQAGGSFVVLIGVRGASLVGDRNSSIFRDLAREKKALYVPDILDEIFNSPSMMSDYVHPNEAGYGKIAERIEQALRPVLDQLK
jgi:acyl-CoA thioesterase-1